MLDLNKELARRLNILSKAKDNPELQAIEKELCKRDPKYFFNTYVYTDKNSTLYWNEEPSKLPFVLYKYQEEFIDETWKSIIEWTKPVAERIDLTNVFIEKSRQLGLSWLVIALFVYGYIYYDHKYLVISQKESDVDKKWDMKSLFEKIRFIIRSLPTWMLPEWLEKESGTEYNKFMSVSRKDWSWSITWESANPNASRWGTYHAIFMDEMAFMQNATQINTAAAAATPCRIFNSTPNGEWNEFFRMKKEAENGNVKRLRYYWSEHPKYWADLKKGDWDWPYTSPWFEWKIKGMTPEKIAQELEIDFNTALEGRVYPEYKWETWDNEYDPTKPLYVWIDNSHGWTDPHAIVIAQTDHHFINIIDCIQINCSIPDMVNFMAWAPKMQLTNAELDFLSRYRNYNWKMATFIADPYDSNSKVVNSHHPDWIFIQDEYNKVGIHLNTPAIVEIKARVMTVRANIYRIRIHSRCADFISSIQNARYPEVKEGSVRTTANDKPIHDWSSHYRTALEYGMCYIIDNENKPEKKFIDTRPVRDTRTWKLIYKTWPSR